MLQVHIMTLSCFSPRGMLPVKYFVYALFDSSAMLVLRLIMYPTEDRNTYTPPTALIYRKQRSTINNASKYASHQNVASVPACAAIYYWQHWQRSFLLELFCEKIYQVQCVNRTTKFLLLFWNTCTSMFRNWRKHEFHGISRNTYQHYQSSL